MNLGRTKAKVEIYINHPSNALSPSTIKDSSLSKEHEYGSEISFNNCLVYQDKVLLTENIKDESTVANPHRNSQTSLLKSLQKNHSLFSESEIMNYSSEILDRKNLEKNDDNVLLTESLRHEAKQLAEYGKDIRSGKYLSNQYTNDRIDKNEGNVDSSNTELDQRLLTEDLVLNTQPNENISSKRSNMQKISKANEKPAANKKNLYKRNSIDIPNSSKLNSLNNFGEYRTTQFVSKRNSTPNTATVVEKESEVRPHKGVSARAAKNIKSSKITATLSNPVNKVGDKKSLIPTENKQHAIDYSKEYLNTFTCPSPAKKESCPLTKQSLKVSAIINTEFKIEEENEQINNNILNTEDIIDSNECNLLEEDKEDNKNNAQIEEENVSGPLRTEANDFRSKNNLQLKNTSIASCSTKGNSSKIVKGIDGFNRGYTTVQTENDLKKKTITYSPKKVREVTITTANGFVTSINGTNGVKAKTSILKQNTAFGTTKKIETKAENNLVKSQPQQKNSSIPKNLNVASYDTTNPSNVPLQTKIEVDAGVKASSALTKSVKLPLQAQKSINQKPLANQQNLQVTTKQSSSSTSQSSTKTSNSSNLSNNSQLLSIDQSHILKMIEELKKKSDLVESNYIENSNRYKERITELENQCRDLKDTGEKSIREVEKLSSFLSKVFADWKINETDLSATMETNQKLKVPVDKILLDFRDPEYHREILSSVKNEIEELSNSHLHLDVNFSKELGLKGKQNRFSEKIQKMKK